MGSEMCIRDSLRRLHVFIAITTHGERVLIIGKEEDEIRASRIGSKGAASEKKEEDEGAEHVEL